MLKMKYIEVESHILASHWIPEVSDDEIGLTKGKFYKLTHREWDSSIVNDNGNDLCEIWLVIDGKFVIPVKDNENLHLRGDRRWNL
ncbi:MAG: hypothetical protein ACXVNF_09505 [Neobacillus sp.]